MPVRTRLTDVQFEKSLLQKRRAQSSELRVAAWLDLAPPNGNFPGWLVTDAGTFRAARYQ